MKKNTVFILMFCLIQMLVNISNAANRVSSYTKTKIKEELPLLGFQLGNEVFLRTFKKESELELWMKPSNKDEFILFRTYPICAFSGGLGPKLMQGDKISPEGFYSITANRLNPSSRFHLSMNMGFPNKYDRFHGRTGNLLMIHGACDSVGCYAMGNGQIEEVYYLIEQYLLTGQGDVSVHSFPFHMTLKNLNEYKGNQWYSFWTELKAGYDEFNQRLTPPDIKIINGHYIIE